MDYKFVEEQEEAYSVIFSAYHVLWQNRCFLDIGPMDECDRIYFFLYWEVGLQCPSAILQ